MSATRRKQLFDSIHDKKSRDVLLENHKHDAKVWSNKLAATVKLAQSTSKKSGVNKTFHGLRILIQRQTLNAIKAGHYETSKGKKVKIDRKDVINSAKSTKFYSSKQISAMECNKNNHESDKKDSDDIQSANDEETDETKANMDINMNQARKFNIECDIDVYNTDCMDAAKELLNNGYNPCLLNMANAKTPGGGYKSGAGAQEENLCRRSTLITALENCIEKKKLDHQRKWKYPIEEFGTIYVPNVIVFRSNEHLGYKYLKKPFKVSMVTAAMFKKPKFDENYDYKKKDKLQIEQKLRSVLRTAYDNGHDSIVLSAWGMFMLSLSSLSILTEFDLDCVYTFNRLWCI